MPNVPRPLKPEVSFAIFEQLDWRVARIISADIAPGTRAPSRRLELDLGRLGRRVAIGQFALIPAEELVDRRVIVCSNLGVRRLGPYTSEVLVLGTPHPDSPPGQAQAIPLYAHPNATCGDAVY